MRKNMTELEELIKLLACPKCKGELKINDAADGVICEQDALLFPIKNGIPVMLADQAVRLDQENNEG